MPYLWPLRRDVPNRPAVGQTFTNPDLQAPLSPIGKGLGGNNTALPVADPTISIDFTPYLNTTLGPPELVNYKQGIIRNATNLLVRSLPILGPIFQPHIGVDWRTRYGGHWLTTIQDQGSCGNCWAFATAALAETTVRIEHGMWSKRSEADVRDSWGLDCAHGASVLDSINWVINHGGISDLDCVPWLKDDDNYFPCPDRSGRAERLPQAIPLNTIADQKKWIDTVGPIVAAFTVYYDFFNWVGPSPYIYDGTSKVDGGHVLLLVGYDDTANCWIAKNSWGTSYGQDGYYLIGYGQVDIDHWTKYGWTNVNPDPWSRRRLHNGNVIQSGNGATHRNFELAMGTSPVNTAYREGEAPYPWAFAYTILDDGPDGKDYSADGLHPGFNCIGQPALTSTSYNRDFEMVYWETGGWMRRWYFSQNSQQWQNTGHIGDGNTEGYPGFIESTGGNFQIVVRSTEGTLDHWYRNPDNAWSWYYGGTISENVLQSGPSLVQANIGDAGNFYVVAVLPSGQMQLFWRDNDAAGTPWHAGEVFGSGVGDTPVVMIQGQFGTTTEIDPGNFELCVVVDGQVEHWWRQNTNLGTQPPVEGTVGPWQRSAVFGSGIVHAWGLIDGSYGNNLELIVENEDGLLAHWYREGIGAWYFTTVVEV